MNDVNEKLHAREPPGLVSTRGSPVPIKGENSLAMLALQRQIDELKANYDSEIKRLHDSVKERLKPLKGASGKKRVRGKVRAEDVIYTWKDEEGKPTCTLIEYLYLIDDRIDDEIDVTYKKVEKNLERIEALEGKITIADIMNNHKCSNCGSEETFSIQLACLSCSTVFWLGPRQ